MFIAYVENLDVYVGVYSMLLFIMKEVSSFFLLIWKEVSGLEAHKIQFLFHDHSPQNKWLGFFF